MRRLAAVLIAASAVTAQAAPKAKVAVMDVKNVQGVAEGTSTILTEIVVSEIARYGMDVVSKADIAAIVGFEKEKTLLGCSDDSSCLAEIGGALGVDYMVTGQVGQIGSRYRLSLLLVDVRKGKVVGRAADFSDKNEDALVNVTTARVREIVAVIQAATAAAVVQRDAKPAPKPAPAPPAVLTPTPTPAPTPAEAAAVEPAPPDEPATPRTPWSRRKILGVSLTGGGGAFLVTGLVFGVKAKRLDSDLAGATNDLGYYYDYPAKRDDVKRTALIADVFYGLGIAAAGAGGFLWWTDRPAAVAVVPVVGDGQAGVVAMGRF